MPMLRPPTWLDAQLMRNPGAEAAAAAQAATPRMSADIAAGQRQIASDAASQGKLLSGIQGVASGAAGIASMLGARDREKQQRMAQMDRLLGAAGVSRTGGRVF